MREKKEVPKKTVKRKKRAGYWENLNFLNYTPDEQHEFTNVDAEDNEEDCTADDTNIISEDNIERIIFEEDELPVHEYTTTADTVDVKATNSRTSTPCSRKKTLTYRPNREDLRNEKIINLLRKKLADKDELMDCLENVVFEEQKSDENENDLFFKYIAALVNKFPARMQAIARQRVFAVVSDLELSQYSVPTTSKTPNESRTPSDYEPANQSD
uniref:BESS domain-containing protein n=1 Tax=Clastoptera arizonana TaxID=38151 RepID=A0A1B6D3R6_9HEMI